MTVRLHFTAAMIRQTAAMGDPLLPGKRAPGKRAAGAALSPRVFTAGEFRQEACELDLSRYSPKRLTALKGHAAKANAVATECMAGVTQDTRATQFMGTMKADTAALLAEIERVEQAQALARAHEEQDGQILPFVRLLLATEPNEATIKVQLPAALNTLKSMVDSENPEVQGLLKQIKDHPQYEMLLSPEQKNLVDGLYIRSLYAEVVRCESERTAADPDLLAEIPHLLEVLELMVRQGVLKIPVDDQDLELEEVLNLLPRHPHIKSFLMETPERKKQYQELYIRTVLRELKDKAAESEEFLGRLWPIRPDNEKFDTAHTNVAGRVTAITNLYANPVAGLANPVTVHQTIATSGETPGTIEQDVETSCKDDLDKLNMQNVYTFLRPAVLRPFYQTLEASLKAVRKEVEVITPSASEEQKQARRAAIEALDFDGLLRQLPDQF